MKRVLLSALGDVVPASIAARQDKMGFPTSFDSRARGRRAFRAGHPHERASNSTGTSLTTDCWWTHWARSRPKGASCGGLSSLKLWQETFHDRAARFGQWARDLARHACVGGMTAATSR